MCLEAFVASEHELPTTGAELPETPSPEFRILPCPVRADAVRGILQLPFVYYLGAHTGCSCGFNSGGVAWQGLATPDDVRANAGALLDDERVAFEAEQASRERLRDVVATARQAGRVRVYACWWGDEALAPIDREDVDADYFAAVVEPLVERVVYDVVVDAEATVTPG